MERTEKKENTKRALILSVSLIFISIILLIGTTFAWFSDSIKSGNNKIMAGNLDVGLYHSNGGAREKVTEETALFNMALWEPGAMVYESFEVVNEGALALNYEFVMNVSKFNIVSETGKSLNDVLKVAVVEGEFSGNREDIDTLDFNQTIKGFVKENALNEKGATDKFTIIVYWKPTENDNDYNLNNGKTANEGESLYIDLGVSLVATQNAHEEDSFGNDYDKHIIDISNSADLISNINTAKKDDVLRLTSDVTVTDKWFIFPANSNVTVDLNNHTLSSGNNTTLYVDPGSTVKIKNGAVDFDRPAMNNPTTYVSKNGTLTLENIEYKSDTASGVMPSGASATINVINCKFNTAGYAISTNANHPEYNPIINIKNSHIVAASDALYYGTPVILNIPGKLNIEDTTIEGHYNGLIVRGGTAVIKNSTITNNVSTAEYVDKYKDTEWESGSGVPAAVITMGNKTDETTYYNYPTNVTLINTTVKSIDNIYPEIYAYGNAEDGKGVTFSYDENTPLSNIVVGNDKVMINGVNAPANE